LVGEKIAGPRNHDALLAIADATLERCGDDDRSAHILVAVEGNIVVDVAGLQPAFLGYLDQRGKAPSRAKIKITSSIVPSIFCSCGRSIKRCNLGGCTGFIPYIEILIAIPT